MLATGTTPPEHEGAVLIEAEGAWREDLADGMVLVMDALHAFEVFNGGQGSENWFT